MKQNKNTKRTGAVKKLCRAFHKLRHVSFGDFRTPLFKIEINAL